jgi:hypothetical protein
LCVPDPDLFIKKRMKNIYLNSIVTVVFED